MKKDKLSHSFSDLETLLKHRTKSAYWLMFILQFTGMMSAVVQGAENLPSESDIVRERIQAYQIAYEKVVLKPTGSAMDKLRNAYSNALKRELLKISSQGGLDESLALEKELQLLRDGKDPQKGSVEETPNLIELRQIWWREKAIIDAERIKSKVALTKQFDSELDSLEARLTKALRLNEAKLIREFRAQIRNDQIEVGTDEETGENLVSQMIWSGAMPIESSGEGILLQCSTKEVPKFQSKEWIKPPFKLIARFIPESHETRIYYGEGQFIFGWDTTPTQIRIHNPLNFDQIQSFAQIAPKPGKECRIEIVVTLTKMSIKIGSNLFYSVKGDYDSLDGPISIGPTFGNKTRLVEFTLIQLPKD